MGFIRGGLSFIIGILLLISFLAMNFFLTLDLSLDYDNVKPKIIFIIKSFSENGMDLTETIKGNFASAELSCRDNTDFVFIQEVYIFEIPCSVVDQGSDAFLDYGLSLAINEVYYKNYECSFFECLKTEFPFFIISEQAKDSSKQKFYFYLVFSLILSTIMFFLITKESGAFIVIGSLLMLSSLPFIRISAFLSFLDNSFLEFIIILFSESYNVFLMSFIIGIIIIGIGIIIKFWNFGSFISEEFGKKRNKDRKE